MNQSNKSLKFVLEIILLQPLRQQPVPLLAGEEADYLLALQKEYIQTMQNSPYFIQAEQAKNGTIYFLKNAKWLVEFERELTSFPSSGSHDDQVDALAYAARFGIVRKTTWSVT